MPCRKLRPHGSLGRRRRRSIPSRRALRRLSCRHSSSSAKGAANCTVGISGSPSRSNIRNNSSSTSLRTGSWPLAEENAGVVPRRGGDPLARIKAAAVGHDRQHQAVVADVIQILDQPLGAQVERVPIVEAAADEGVERFGSGKIFGQQRPIEIAGQQPAAGGRLFGRARLSMIGSIIGPGQCPAARPVVMAKTPNLAVNGRRVPPPIGEQDQRRLGARPEDDPMAQRAPAVRSASSSPTNTPESSPDRHHHSRGVRFQQTDAQRLRHVAGIFDFEDVRLARIGDRQGISVPAGFLWPSSPAASAVPSRGCSQRAESPLFSGSLRPAGHPRPFAGPWDWPDRSRSPASAFDVSAAGGRGGLSPIDDQLNRPLGERLFPGQSLAQTSVERRNRQLGRRLRPRAV